MANLGTVTRGDTETINLTIKNPDGSARDITTDSIKFTVKKRVQDASYVVQKTVGSGIVKTNAAGGLATVTLNPADLNSLAEPRTLVCDIEVTTSGGAVATTLHTLEFVLDVS